MSVHITLLARHEVISGGLNQNRFRATVIADLWLEMLPRKKIRQVNVLVTKQAELGGVSFTVENRDLLTTEIIGHGLFDSSRPRAHHFSLSLSLAFSPVVERKKP